VAVTAAAPAPRRRLTTMEHVWMNLFWFAHNLHWAALMSIVIPSQVDKFLGNKETNLSLVVVWGTLVAVLVHPWAGAVSDRAKSRHGRRRPFLLWATIPNIIGLIYMATTESLVAMSVAFVLVQLSNNIANSPYVAIIADRVPEEQRGTASGWFGFMSVLGTIAGAGVAGMLLDKTAPIATYRQQLLLVYGIIATVQLISVLLTWFMVKEEPAEGGPALTWQEYKGLFWLDHRKHPDFAWVYVTRFLVQQGQWAIFYYLQYYFEDVMHLPGEKTVFTFTAACMAAAAATVLFSGTLSDRYGRKLMVYIAGGMMTLVALLFIFFPYPALVLPAGILFGLGWGAFTSVDQAMATDVLPNQEDYGKDMGIWQVASILPQITGILLGGLLLSGLRTLPNQLGYSVLMAVTTLFFGLGTYFIRKVKGVR